MARMERFYDELLVEQLQAQEAHFAERARATGFAAAFRRLFAAERHERERIDEQWLAELRVAAGGVTDVLVTRAKVMRTVRAHVAGQAEEHAVALATANAAREKYKKFSQQQQRQQQQANHPLPPATPDAVRARVDAHPDVVALEAEIASLMAQLSSS
jgi:hypothetical protein